MTKNKLFFIFTVIVVALIISIIGIYLYTQQQGNWPPPNVVKEPGEGGQWVLVNELVILESGQDVQSLIAEFGGEITFSVPETDSYQVKFPVSSLEELDVIADKLRKKEKGIQVLHVFLIPPPKPGEPW